jgi:hypothetical protein
MKALGSSSQPILNSDGWRLFSLLIVCVTLPILLSIMLSSSSGDIGMLDRPQQHRLTFQHRPDEEDEIEGFERSIIVDIKTIHSEVKALSDNNQQLSLIYRNTRPGLLIFSQASKLEQTMDAPNPSIDDLNASKDFSFNKVGRGHTLDCTQVSNFWCNDNSLSTV